MRVEDDAKKVAELVKKVMTDADLVVTTGGVSVGKKDIMHEVLKILKCEKLFWRIAVKPGMPTLCASSTVRNITRRAPRMPMATTSAASPN